MAGSGCLHCKPELLSDFVTALRVNWAIELSGKPLRDLLSSPENAVLKIGFHQCGKLSELSFVEQSEVACVVFSSVTQTS